MKIGLIGWGIETKSVYQYFGDEHTYLITSEETRTDFPSGANVTVQTLEGSRPPGLTGTVTDLSYLKGIELCDVIFYSPTARKNLEKLFPAGSQIWQKLTSTTNYFLAHLPTKNTIGVTGTKGKGTTTTLIAEILKAAGKTVHIGGNIGVPVLDLLPAIQPDDWVVLELSSFQLYKLSHSPHIAVHLMMIPEHIDEWHKTMDDYVSAKRNIFAHQTPDDIAVYFAANQFAKDNAESSPGTRIPYFQPPGAFVDENSGNITIADTVICNRSEVGLLGEHNLQNICAAVTAAWQVTQNVAAFREVLTTFKGLEHRLEFAGEVNGVRYYDDSFGTTPDTAVVACDAFNEPKVIIVGGHDKGNDYTPLARRLREPDIRHAVFIGTTGKKIFDMAVSFGFDSTKGTVRDDGNSWTMADIVDTARRHALEDDIILLSTGSASFGLFNDYKDRGNQFLTIVAALQAPASARQ